MVHYLLLMQVYEGERSNFRLQELHEDTEYQVRVGGVRVREDGEKIVGPYSPKTTFNTHLIIIKSLFSSPSSPSSSSYQAISVSEGVRRMTTKMKCFLLDNMAVLMMLLFAMVAVSLAVLARHLIDHNPQHKFLFPPNKPR